MKTLLLVLLLVAVTIATEEPTCPCPRIYTPVCGTDNRTYGNDCLFRCAQKQRTELRIARRGRCDD